MLTTTAHSALFFTAQKPGSLWNETLSFTPELYSSPLLSCIEELLESARDLAEKFYFDIFHNNIFYHNIFITDDRAVYITKRVNGFTLLLFITVLFLIIL